ERFGVLFQGGALFDSLSVFDNVAFPLREKNRRPEAEVRARVDEALAAVALEGAEGKQAAELSGGMRKRVALAPALIERPRIILFDEPTAGLDPILERSVYRLIRATHRRYGFTAVVVSHDVPRIFEIVDRVALLHEGAIVEEGSTEEFAA